MGKIMAAYYRMTGITGLVRSQRIAGVGAGTWFLRHLANEATHGLPARGSNQPPDQLTKGQENRRDDAQRLLSELGVHPDQHMEFRDWLNQFPTLPPLDNVVNDPMGQLYSLGINRFLNRTNQDPMKADKAMGASNDPSVRMMTSLMGFNYGFQRNIIDPQVEAIKHAFHRERARGSGYTRSAAAAANASIGRLATAGALVGIALLMGAPLAYMLYRDKWDENDKAGDLGSWLIGRAVDQSGLGGTLSTLGQIYTNLRYETDLLRTYAGAGMGWLLGNMQQAIRPYTPGPTPTTNTEVYDQTHAMLNLTYTPATLAALTLLAERMPGGPTSIAAMVAAWALTSPSTTGAITEQLVGPKGAGAETGGSPLMPGGNGPPGMLPGMPGGTLPGLGGGDDEEEDKTTASGTPSPASSLFGFADDFAAPVISALPAPAKGTLIGLAAVWAVWDWNQRAAEFRNAPAPEKP